MIHAYQYLGVQTVDTAAFDAVVLLGTKGGWENIVGSSKKRKEFPGSPSPSVNIPIDGTDAPAVSKTSSKRVKKKANNTKKRKRVV